MSYNENEWDRRIREAKEINRMWRAILDDIKKAVPEKPNSEPVPSGGETTR